MRIPISFALLSLLATTAAAQAPNFRAFDAYVARGVEEWQVPGLAVAVVHGESVVFAKGYGVRTLGTTDLVDIYTLFANASTTKAFTAMAVGMMVDQGQIGWDDPVVAHIPEFRLHAPYATSYMTIRDLLTHQTGFGDPSYLWYGTTAEFPQILARLKFVELSSQWSPRFAYNNVTYATAGVMIARAGSTSWGEQIRRTILAPLHMRETVTHTPEAATHPNIASPHYRFDDSVHVIERYHTDNIAPAGAMYSSVLDMTRWIRVLLDSARTGEGRLVSDTVFAEMFTPQVVVPPDEFYPTAQLTHPNFAAYGFGWFLEDYRGEKVAFHTGSIDGMSAIVGLLPARRVGVVIFANLDHAELRHALMYRVFDLYLGAPRRDWSREMHMLYRELAEQRNAEVRAMEGKRVLRTVPTLSLGDYVGTYQDDLYGRMVVRVEDDRLVAEASPFLVADLEHWNYDTFRIVWRKRWLGEGTVVFQVGADGVVGTLDLGDGRTLTRVTNE